ncbi:hypothetical protein GGR53DRAFT_365089 [Hypoxylon sp. FL1150]|nr:hypothetical protein GGR53DRAFT_365089 [Hypoxylon sp. FL1150]
MDKSIALTKDSCNQVIRPQPAPFLGTSIGIFTMNTESPKARRSRTGCVTCRNRKVRCNEEHFVCRACTRLRLTCKYLLPGETSGLVRRNSRPRQPKF